MVNLFPLPLVYDRMLKNQFFLLIPEPQFGLERHFFILVMEPESHRFLNANELPLRIFDLFLHHVEYTVIKPQALRQMVLADVLGYECDPPELNLGHEELPTELDSLEN